MTAADTTTSQRDELIVQMINAGKTGPEVAAALGWPASRRGHVYNIYRRATGKSAGSVRAQALTVSSPAFASLAPFITRNSLDLPKGLSEDAWSNVIRFLIDIEDGSPWWLGDALLYGERVFGETYAQVAEATRKDVQTLMNAVWVCRKFPKLTRHPQLKHAHHAEVAAMEPRHAQEWLSLAAENTWSRNQLRAEIAKAKAIAAPRTTPPLLPPAEEALDATVVAHNPAATGMSTPPPDMMTRFFADLEPSDPSHPSDQSEIPNPRSAIDRSLHNDPTTEAEAGLLSILQAATDMANSIRLLLPDFNNTIAQMSVRAALTAYDAITG